jgi:hypothetical protein
VGRGLPKGGGSYAFHLENLDGLTVGAGFAFLT